MPLTIALLRQVLDLMDGVEVWHELKRRMDAAGLTQDVGPDGMQAVLDHWHRSGARRLSDPVLAAELHFWSDGGAYATHVQGFSALRPRALVDEAGRRGWFVRELARGGWVVNPPDSQPLFLPAAGE